MVNDNGDSRSETILAKLIVVSSLKIANQMLITQSQDFHDALVVQSVSNVGLLSPGLLQNSLIAITTLTRLQNELGKTQSLLTNEMKDILHAT